MLPKEPNVCPDDKLLILIRQDDKKAFDLIYKRYWENLFVYVNRVVDDKDEAQDIVQEIFVSLWSRRAQSANILSLKAYLFSMARHSGLKYIRNNINKATYLDSLKMFFDEDCDQVNQEMDANELRVIIYKEIEQLPAKMKEVFILSRNENLSYKMISEKLMISEKTVKKQINNVLKHLRLKLADKILFFTLLWFFL